MDVRKWQEMSTRLKALKIEEAELRRDICEHIIDAHPMKNGRVTVRNVLQGLPVKAVQSLSYSLDEAVLTNVWEVLTPTDKAAIKLKPQLIIGKYKKLDDSSLLHDAVVTKLAMPTLEIGK